MKAHKLITSINNILNEVTFAKYTLQQTYDEMVEKEDFGNYLKKLALKAVRLTNLDYLIGIKARDGASYTDNMIAFALTQKKNNYQEELFIQLHITEGYIEVYCAVGKRPAKKESSPWCNTSNRIFSLKEAGVIDELKVAIKDACESPEVRKLRQEYLSKVRT